MSVSWVAGERPAEVRFSGDFAGSAAAAILQLRVFLDAASGDAYLGTPLISASAPGAWNTLSFQYKLPALTPGSSHTVRLAINVPAGASANIGGSTTSPGSLRVVAL